MNEAGELASFFMQDAMGRQSRVLLSNRQRNTSLPKSLFEFNPPEGTERLRQ
jgi:outer membrane lipoprotein-sorting protein